MNVSVVTSFSVGVASFIHQEYSERDNMNVQSAGQGITQSESIAKIGKALFKVQSEMIAVSKDADNTFYKSKYATLQSVWSTLQPLLKDAELVVMQSAGSSAVESTRRVIEPGKYDKDKTIHVVDESVILMRFTTRIAHSESVEWIESIGDMPVKRLDPQGYGSAIPYSRRYCLSALLGIVVDDDDDGNAGSVKSDKKELPPPPNYVTEKKPEKKIKATERVQNFLYQSGCKTPPDKDLVIKFINPKESVETVKTDAIAERFIEEINAVVKSK